MNYTKGVYQEVILCLIHISIINDNKGLGTSRQSFSYNENTHMKLRAFPGTPAAFRLRINIRVLVASGLRKLPYGFIDESHLSAGS